MLLLIPDILPVFCLLRLVHGSPRQRPLRVLGDLDRLQGKTRFCGLVREKCGLIVIKFNFHLILF